MSPALLDQIKGTTLCRMCIAVTFFTSGLVINIMQLLLHVLLKPINERLFRKLMYYLCYSLYSQFIFLTDWYANAKLHVYMDAEDERKYSGKEHVLLMMNHSYEIDWLAGWMFCEKMQVLGNCKAYAKKVISYVPIIGWAWKFAEFVFLERSFDKDKEIIAHQLKVVYSYPDPMWLLLNAEGTRFTPQKHEASVQFAKERGMTVLKHHLIPRTKGFTASLPSMRGLCPAIYDINLAFKKNDVVPPTMISVLTGQPIEAYMLVRRIPLEQVPEGEKEAADWLQKLFIEKDKIIDSFHETGSFFETSGVPKVQGKLYDRRLCSLLNFVAWAVVCLSLIMYYLISFLLTRNWLGLSISGSILLLIYLLMEKGINMSKISKSSSYGSGPGTSATSST